MQQWGSTMHGGNVHVEIAFLISAIRTMGTGVRLLASVDEKVSAKQLALVLAAEHLTTDMTGKAASPALGHPAHLQHKHLLQTRVY